MLSIRTTAAVLAAALLSACVTTEREPDLPTFTLDGSGIAPSVSGLRIDFGRAQVGVIDTVTRLLDDAPVAVTTNAECGAGPVTAAVWEDGLTLNFMDGNFMGWTNSDPTLPTTDGFVPGQSRLEMPPVSFQITSLGAEFNRGDIFGLLDESETRIDLLWAGVTCFFR